MIRSINGRFDDYSISPKIRQILLHWGYELVESDLLWLIFLFALKWSIIGLIDKNYCGGKEKAAKHYIANKGVILYCKKKQKISIKICQKKKKKQKENMARIDTKTWKKNTG